MRSLLHSSATPILEEKKALYIFFLPVVCWKKRKKKRKKDFDFFCKTKEITHIFTHSPLFIFLSTGSTQRHRLQKNIQKNKIYQLGESESLFLVLFLVLLFLLVFLFLLALLLLLISRGFINLIFIFILRITFVLSLLAGFLRFFGASGVLFL